MRVLIQKMINNRLSMVDVVLLDHLIRRLEVATAAKLLALVHPASMDFPAWEVLVVLGTVAAGQRPQARWAGRLELPRASTAPSQTLYSIPLVISPRLVAYLTRLHRTHTDPQDGAVSWSHSSLRTCKNRCARNILSTT